MARLKKISNLVELENGYFVTRKGEVLTPAPYYQKVTPYCGCYAGSHIRMVKDGMDKRVCLPKLVYESFSGNKLKSNEVIRFLDGDTTNAAFENLYVEERTQFANKGYKRILDDALIKKIRKDRKNGMTYNAIASKHGISKSTVGKALGTWHPMKHRKEYYDELKKYRKDTKKSRRAV